MHVEKINLYKDREDVSLTTYLINDNQELAVQGNRPAVLICPGGGYFSCSEREAEPIAFQFMAMGYHAFILRYSTYGEGQVGYFPDLSKPLEKKEQVNHPAPVRELGMAMKEIKSHADAWKVDAEKIAVCGFSAGAHNAAMYSVYYDKPLVTDYVGATAEELRPAATILGYCLSDYVFMKEAAEKASPMDQIFFAASNMAFLGKDNPTDEELKAVSPAMLVDKNTPPMYIWATASDNLVPVQHSLRMAHALADQGIPFELHVFESGMHGLACATQLTALATNHLDQDAAKWVPLCGSWLMKRFAMEMPEPIDYSKLVEQSVV